MKRVRFVYLAYLVADGIQDCGYSDGRYGIIQDIVSDLSCVQLKLTPE